MNGIYYVVYKNPSDFPGQIVVRKYSGLGTAETKPEEAQVFDSLKNARVYIQAYAPGFSCFTRHQDDDSVIVETWL